MDRVAGEKAAQRARRTMTGAMLLGGAAMALMAVNDDNGCSPAGDEREGERAACQADSDCDGDPGVDCVGQWECVTGQCAFECGSPPPPPPPPETGCYSDDDCERGQVCNAGDVCLPPPGCTPGAPCPDVCYGQCVDVTPPPPGTFCTSTASCQVGEYCTTEDGACESNCPADMACPAVCWGECKRRPDTQVCYADSECAWGEFCNRQPCVFPGEAPSDGDAQRPACGGVCSPTETCQSDRDCDAGEYCGCGGSGMANGLIACVPQCLPRDGGCSSDVDCRGGQYCQNGVCNNIREECWGNEQCPSGWSCQSTCDAGFAPPNEPTDPSDPDDANRPAPCASYCVPPTGQTCGAAGFECGAGERCESVCWTICPACQCAEERDDCACECVEECTSICVPTGDPVTCTSDGECREGNYCDFSTCWGSTDPADGSAERPIMCLGECRPHTPPDYDCKEDADCVAADGQQGVCEFQVCEAFAAMPCDPSGQSCDPMPPPPACAGYCNYEQPQWCNPWQDHACPDGFTCQSDCGVGLPNGLIVCPSRCVADDAEPVDPPTDACVRTGCSGQVCAPEHVFTTCEWQPWYMCYREAICGVAADGTCGWTQTDAFSRCMDEQGAFRR